jgi:glucose/arabinose dehydrogenase
MTDEKPTRERPLAIGEHRVFYTHDTVPVLVYRGDVSPDEARAIVAFTSRTGSLAMVIADVQELGAFGAKTRKALIDPSGRKDVLTGDELFVVISGANVVRRAIMSMVTTAGRIVASRKIRVVHAQSLDDALVVLDDYIKGRAG